MSEFINEFINSLIDNYSVVCFNYEINNVTNYYDINKIIDSFDYIITNEKPWLVNKMRKFLRQEGKIILIGEDIDIERFDYIVEKNQGFYILNQTNQIFSNDYTLTTNSYDVNDFMTIPAILDLLQDCAGIHADKLGVGYNEFASKNYAWVLMRTKLILSRQITENKVVIRTWQSNEGRVDFDRNLIIESIDGEVLGRAVTKWCVIDYESRRIIPSSKLNTNNTFSQLLNSERFDKISKSITCANNYKSFVVQPLMIDHNGHVNNTKYAEMVMNLLPLGFKVKEFEINYIHEAIHGDVIDLYWQNEDDEYVFEGKLKDVVSMKAKVKTWKD